MRSAIDASKGGTPYLVFSSRYGECEQTLRQLRLLSELAPLSPTRFGMSVHNALAGAFSILNNNTAPHTAIAAGRQSFEHALLESISLVTEDASRQVLLVHYDEPIPEYYEVPTTEQPALAMALLLGASSGEPMVLRHTDEIPEYGDSALAFIRYLTCKQGAWIGATGRQRWKCLSDAS